MYTGKDHSTPDFAVERTIPAGSRTGRCPPRTRRFVLAAQAAWPYPTMSTGPESRIRLCTHRRAAGLRLTVVEVGFVIWWRQNSTNLEIKSRN